MKCICFTASISLHAAQSSLLTPSRRPRWPWLGLGIQQHDDIVICRFIPNANIDYDQGVHACAKRIIELAELNELLGGRHVTQRYKCVGEQSVKARPSIGSSACEAGCGASASMSTELQSRRMRRNLRPPPDERHDCTSRNNWQDISMRIAHSRGMRDWARHCTYTTNPEGMMSSTRQ